MFDTIKSLAINEFFQDIVVAIIVVIESYLLRCEFKRQRKEEEMYKIHNIRLRKNGK